MASTTGVKALTNTEHSSTLVEGSLGSSPLMSFHRMGIEKTFVAALDELSNALLRLTCKYYYHLRALNAQPINVLLLLQYGDRTLLNKANKDNKEILANLNCVGTMDLLLYFEDKIKGNGIVMDKIMIRVSRSGDIEMMKLLHEWGCTIMDLNGVVMGGNVSAMRLLLSWGAKIHSKQDPRAAYVEFDSGPSIGKTAWFLPTDSEYLLSSAIKANNDAMLLFLLERGFTPSIENVRKAISYFNLTILRILKDKGCPIDGNTIGKGVNWGTKFGHISKFLKFLLDWYGKVDEEIFCCAVRGGNVETLAFMKENYSVPETEAYMAAALVIGANNNLAVVQQLHEWGFPWNKSPETFKMAVYTHKHDIMRFFYEQGCPFAEDGSSAEGVRDIETLELLHSWGVPFNEHLMTTAVYEENIEMMRKLHSYGVGFEQDGRTFSSVFWREEEVQNDWRVKKGETMKPSEMARLLYSWGCPIGDTAYALSNVAKAGNTVLLKMMLDEWNLYEGIRDNTDLKQRMFLLGSSNIEMLQMLYDRGFRWPPDGSALVNCFMYRESPTSIHPTDLLLDWGHPVKIEAENLKELMESVFRQYPVTKRLAEAMFKEGIAPDETFYQENVIKCYLPAFVLMKQFGIEDNGMCMREAARTGDAEFLKALLDAGYKWDSEGVTMLNAVKSRNLGLIRSLIEWGCPLSQEAAETAQGIGNKAILEFLEQHAPQG